MATVQLQTRVTQSMRKAWFRLASAQRLSGGELLRQLVISVLDEKGAPVAPPGEEPDSTQYDSTLQTRIDRQTKAEWITKARRVGINPSDMLRSAIAAVLDRYPEARAEGEDGAANPEDRPRTVKVGLNLNTEEFDAVTRAAGALGWRRNTWIVNVVRTAVFREPRPTDAELAALNRATGELLAVGRNLNQIARALHRDDRYKESVTVERLDEVRREVSRQTEAFSTLLAAIEARWRTPEGFRPETE